jgi:hypothetical protein
MSFTGSDLRACPDAHLGDAVRAAMLPLDHWVRGDARKARDASLDAGNAGKPCRLTLSLLRSTAAGMIEL